jgi:glycerophosphoryl diester phosphodiesterase
VFSNQGVKRCGTDYAKWGWTGFVPASCRDQTIIVPLNYRWLAWGWPYRFLDRMTKANTRVLLFGDYRDGVAAGIETIDQLDKIPRDFRGYLWIEDYYTVGRSLQP